MSRNSGSDIPWANVRLGWDKASETMVWQRLNVDGLVWIDQDRTGHWFWQHTLTVLPLLFCGSMPAMRSDFPIPGGRRSDMGQHTIEVMHAISASIGEILTAIQMIHPIYLQDYLWSSDVALCLCKEFPGHECLRSWSRAVENISWIWQESNRGVLGYGILPEHLAAANLCACQSRHLLFP